MPPAIRLTHPKSRQPRLAAILAASLAVALAACKGGGSDPRLESLSLGDGTAYAAVGVQQQLAATGVYSDGKTRDVTQGLTWFSSDPAVVSVDATGQLIPWAAGEVQVSATDDKTGVSASLAVVSRVIVALSAGDALPASGQVDTTAAYFRVSGLTPGTMYTPTLVNLSDDADLAVFSDISMTPETRLCYSAMVGEDAERCTAPANAAGELWIGVDGQWTHSGATFHLDVPVTAEVTLAGTLAFPGEIPYAGAVGPTKQFLKITGLTVGTTYEVRLSDLAADLDLEAYRDTYEYASVCESFREGTVDDFCSAAPNAAGELVVEIDGQTSTAGSAYTLALTAQ